jgi:hypothetical protein
MWGTVCVRLYFEITSILTINSLPILSWKFPQRSRFDDPLVFLILKNQNHCYLFWFITLHYSYLLRCVAVASHCCYSLWFVTPCFALLLPYSTLFPSIQLTLPCVVVSCYGSWFLSLHCLLIEVMYFPLSCNVQVLKLGAWGVIFRK